MNIKINCRLSAYSKGTLPDLSKIVLEVNENPEGIYYVRTYDEELKMLPDAINQVLSGSIERTGASTAGSVLLMIPPIVIISSPLRIESSIFCI